MSTHHGFHTALSRRLATCLALAAALALGLIIPTRASAGPPPIVLDGDFAEWNGRIAIPDTSAREEPFDQKSVNFIEDIQWFYYGTNPGESWLFFRVGRYPKPTGGTRNGISQPVYYGIFIDFNNTHRSTTDRFQGYQDPEDYVLYCAYTPDPGSGLPIAHVYLVPAPAVFQADELDPAAILWEAQGPWGQPYDSATGTGGLIVEFGVPFEAFDPDFQPGQVIQFFLGATLNDPLNKIDYPQQDFCPNEGCIQDAPVPILGLLGTILLLGVGLAVAYLTMRRSGPDPAGGGVSPR